MLQRRSQILLIILVAVAVFYPTFFAEFCRVDDLQMVSSLKSIQHISFKDIFIPGASGGLYYRPLIHVSFLLDRFVFGIDSFTMHFHNLVLHTLNAILLYGIARKVGKWISVTSPYMPFVVALLFLLHPITTESVNWVSGRTDILAGTFLLASTSLIFNYLESGKRISLYTALALFICAVLTKEFSLAFLPGFVWLSAYRNSFRSSAKTWLMLALLGTVAVGLFFMLRSMAFSSNATPISTTLMIIFNTPKRSLQLVLTAIGFYVKKLFIPMPLNFAIYEVNALYELAAWPILALLGYIAWKRTLLSILFISGILLASPALVIVFNQVAWTPFAERYLYLPAAFVTLSTTYYLQTHIDFPNKCSKSIIVIALITLFAGVTFQRNWTWKTAYTIVGDTIQKSPESSEMKFVYAAILVERGEHEKARGILTTVKSPPGIFYEERGDLIEVDILEREGKRDNAITQLEYVLKSSGNKSAKALNALLERYLEEEKRTNYTTTLFYRHKTLNARKKLFRLTHDATILYDLANDSLILGDRQKAKTYFRLASGNIPLKDLKNERSKTMLQSLNSKN